MGHAERIVRCIILQHCDDMPLIGYLKPWGSSKEEQLSVKKTLHDGFDMRQEAGYEETGEKPKAESGKLKWGRSGEKAES
jgi:hypothetical protein